ncbi:MAG: endonuclease [Bacteroidetes bacterium]|nr:MAG: endonuclease [Bacteroidota bacterium]
MKRLLILLLLLPLAPSLPAQSFTLMSWNIQHLGRTKDAQKLAVMVDLMHTHDLVLIQEVVSKDPAGAQKVAAIADALNRTGSRWDYRVSDPPQATSQQRERYAILWKTSKLELLGRPYLDTVLAGHCWREPYLARFRLKGSGTFWVANFHARSHSAETRDEVRLLASLPPRFDEPLLIGGDFNLEPPDETWAPLLQQGYAPALAHMPTTLKKKCTAEGEYFNHAIDNVYVPTTGFQVIEASRIDFVGSCDQLEQAREVSDHVPVWVRLRME